MCDTEFVYEIRPIVALDVRCAWCLPVCRVDVGKEASYTRTVSVCQSGSKPDQGAHTLWGKILHTRVGEI